MGKHTGKAKSKVDTAEHEVELEDFRASQRAIEKKHLHGRWMTDRHALQFPEVRHREVLQRTIPKRLSRMDLYKLEAADGGLDLAEHEVSDRVTQSDIVSAVDHQTRRKRFDLVLDKLGPYSVNFSKNGTHVLLAGLRGHMATLRWADSALEGETQLRDRCTDATFLVDHSLIAAAQKKFVYMYTKDWEEVHVLPKMANVDRLAYLPKHLLLAGASTAFSILHYIDISTGQDVATKTPATVKDPSRCIRANPENGVVATGDLRGVVKFWAPSTDDPLMQLKAHRGVVIDAAFHPSGRFLVTLGGDHKLKVWDMRVMRALDEYAVSYCFDTVDVSARGVLAMGGGTNIQIWKDLFTSARPSSPYMNHRLGYAQVAQQVRFAPFEDVLGVGHSLGYSSLIVPGSGEPNPDFYYANPLETELHRKERVVSTLLDKLPPDTISMNLNITGVNTKRLEEYQETLRQTRRQQRIRERKEVPVPSMGASAPHGLTMDADTDEVDEVLGFEEAGPISRIVNKKERKKEKKKVHWDKKDAPDKVRSKQKLRTSRLAMRTRRKLKVVATKALVEKRRKTMKEVRSKGGVPVDRASRSKRVQWVEQAGALAARHKRDEDKGNAAFARFQKKPRAEPEDGKLGATRRRRSATAGGSQ